MNGENSMEKRDGEREIVMQKWREWTRLLCMETYTNLLEHTHTPRDNHTLHGTPFHCCITIAPYFLLSLSEYMSLVINITITLSNKTGEDPKVRTQNILCYTFVRTTCAAAAPLRTHCWRAKLARQFPFPCFSFVISCRCRCWCTMYSMDDFFLCHSSFTFSYALWLSTREVNGRECLRFNFIYVNLMCLQHFVGIFLLCFFSRRHGKSLQKTPRTKLTKAKPKQKKNCTASLCAKSIFFLLLHRQ